MIGYRSLDNQLGAAFLCQVPPVLGLIKTYTYPLKHSQSNYKRLSSKSDERHRVLSLSLTKI